MEVRSPLVQKIMLWDYVVVGTLLFIIMGTEQTEFRLLEIGMMVLLLIGGAVLFFQTCLRKTADIYQGFVFMTVFELLSIGAAIYYEDPIIIHLLFILIIITIAVYRNFQLCELSLVVTFLQYLFYFGLVREEVITIGIEVYRMVWAAVGVMGSGVVLATIIGNEEKNRRVIRENRRTSLDMLKLVEMKKEEAEHMANVKSAFLANMSHEIRTPINAVLGMNELILREANQKDVLDYAYNIELAGKALLSIVNDILDISKIESGKTELVSGEYNVAASIYNFIEMSRARAEKKGILLKVDIAENLPSKMYGDEMRLKQIYTNILNNAIKYTEKGEITLTLTGEEIGDDKIFTKATISDTGIGIREEDLDKIFDAFQRVDEEKNQKIEGTGLGMSITKQLVELMGGKIYVESEYGKGSTFHVELVQGIVDRTPIGRIDQAVEQNREIEKHKRAVLLAPEAKLLVVDDNQMNLNVMKGLLKRTEMQVDLVLSGKEALEAVTKTSYDVILMDHMMPEMDGVEALHRLRKLKENQNPQAKVIVLTANAAIGSREEYLKMGFDDYLSKPIEAMNLENMIKKYLPKELVHEIEEVVEETQNLEEIEFLEEKLRPFGIHLKQGLIYVEGELEQYVDMVKLFLRQSEARKEKMRGFLKEGNTEEYTIEVHALKSNGKMIGSRKMSELAYEMEIQGRNGKLEYLRQNQAKLEEGWEELEQGLRILMEEQQKTVMEETVETMTPEEVQVRVERLRNAIEEMDVEVAQEELETLLCGEMEQSQKERFMQVRNCLEEFSYQEALEILE
ncbi:MAG: ATP-binding protein [Lachnospiraceae bacterium]|nr:ATP-binding protein [Lachnospiraceae bacterium]MDD7379158.1 ATP-binding protein [Lachnospiraceae bacterium]MDY4617128.1 ATP-binding protein [Lachnospiraceae bacterium]